MLLAQTASILLMESPQSSCNIRRWDILKRTLNNLEPADFLRKLSQSSSPLLIDVRTPDEFASGSLPHALNLDFLGATFWEGFDALDKTQATFVFCRSSRRSTRTAMLMKNGGFQEVYNLEGGLGKLLDLFPEALLLPQ